MRAATSAEPHGTGRSWLGVGVITLSLFTFVTTELMPVGLLTPVGHSLNITAGTAGLMVTFFGLAAGLGAPALMSWTSRVDRRMLLTALLLVLTVGNLVTATANTFPVVVMARLIMGFANGLFWAIGIGTAVRLVPEHRAGRASSVALSGISIAAVVGIPMGTLLEDLTSWRTTFVIWAGLSLICAVLVGATLPRLPSTSSTTVGEVFRLPLDNPLLRRVIAAMALFVLGHFAVYTYLRPWLEESSGASPTTIVILLVVYGIAGAAGNFLAGHWAQHRAGLAFLMACLGVATSLVLLRYGTSRAVTAAAVLTLWGIAFGAANLCQVSLVLRSAPESFEAAMSINTLAYNTSIALGALAGGVLADDNGITAAIWLGAAFCAVSVLAQLASRIPRQDGASKDRATKVA